MAKKAKKAEVNTKQRIYVNFQDTLNNVMAAVKQSYEAFADKDNIKVSKSGFEYTTANIGNIQARCFAPNAAKGIKLHTVYFTLLTGEKRIDLPFAAKIRSIDDISLVLTVE